MTIKFEDLKPSTITAEVYLNITIDIHKLFDLINIDITNIEYEVSKKHKNIIRKSVSNIDQGFIYSAQLANSHKGLYMLKAEKKGKRRYFRNQLMMYMHMDTFNVNIMMFKENFKIVGCVTEEQMVEVCQYLLSD